MHLNAFCTFFLNIANLCSKVRFLPRGVGREADVSALAAAFWEEAAARDIGIWVERVDSGSNWADGPTRPDEPGKSRALMELRPRRVQERVPRVPYLSGGAAPSA